MQSTVGEGSSFTLRLELAVADAPHAAATPASTGSSAAADHALRVLVAEDTPASQMVIRLILERLGHTVRVASDGAEAVSLFSTAAFDLVLMDIQMPAMDGYAATRMIRMIETERNDKAGGEPRKILIYGLSAFAQTADRDLAFNAGMDGYIPKPVKVETIEQMLSGLPPRPDAGAPAAAASGGADLIVSSAELVELAEALGTESFAAAVNHFARDMRGSVERLELALARQDRDETRKSAHRIKGLLLQFGVPGLARRVAALEAAAHRPAPGNPEAAQANAAQELCALCLAAIDAVGEASTRIIKKLNAGEST